MAGGGSELGLIITVDRRTHNVPRREFWGRNTNPTSDPPGRDAGLSQDKPIELVALENRRAAPEPPALKRDHAARATAADESFFTRST